MMSATDTAAAHTRTALYNSSHQGSSHLQGKGLLFVGIARAACRTATACRKAKGCWSWRIEAPFWDRPLQGCSFQSISLNSPAASHHMATGHLCAGLQSCMQLPARDLVLTLMWQCALELPRVCKAGPCVRWPCFTADGTPCRTSAVKPLGCMAAWASQGHACSA